jgi:hypothetical protein
MYDSTAQDFHPLAFIENFHFITRESEREISINPSELKIWVLK